MTIAEIILSFLWFFNQAFRWRLVNRSVMTEKLPPDEKLPGLDIFVCTIDPEKEPTVDVMNTVISAIAMDYPSNKLSIYLSDDGGSPITLFGIKEAFQFAKVWVPFCEKYDVKSRCPKFFFTALGENERLHRPREFEEERDQIKVFFNLFIYLLLLSKVSLLNKLISEKCILYP
jgi:cellulose synthase/poly-beta-1,6-N-acetylglucosamine synthase-like glycosyltransferase